MARFLQLIAVFACVALASQQQTLIKMPMGSAPVVEQPDAILSLSSNLVSQVISGMKDYIELLVINDVVVPGATSKHYSYGSFNFSTIDTSAITVSFGSPSRAYLNLQQLMLVVPSTPFSVFDTIVVKLQCNGAFWGTMTNANVSVGFDFVTLPNGTLQIANVSSIVDYGLLNVQHSVSGDLCKIGQDIFQLFEGSVNAVIEQAVEETVPQLLATLVTPMLNKALIGLPAGIITGQPFVEGSLFSVDFDIRALFGQDNIPAIVPPHVGSLPQLPNRDFAVSINAGSMDEVLAILAADGKLDISKTIATVNTSSIAILLPGASALCSGCPLNIGADVSNGASLRTDFSNGTFVIKATNLILHLNAVAKNGSLVELAIFSINATLDLNDVAVHNNTILFTVSAPELVLGVIASYAGPLDGPSLTALLDLLVNNLLLPKFNKEFKGIYLPLEKNGAGIAHTTAVVQDNYLIIAGDLVSATKPPL